MERIKAKKEMAEASNIIGDNLKITDDNVGGITMQRINLVVINLPWVRFEKKPTFELWNAYYDEEVEDFLKRKEFENKATFYLGCFEVQFGHYYVNVSYDDFIDRVVLKYNECKLTVEFYKECKLIESFDVDDYKYVKKHNIDLLVSKF